MANPLVFKQFFTERYKRMFYPIRPLFTLAVTAATVGLGFLGILPMNLALFLALMHIDDLVVSPFLKVAQSVENLLNGRKKTKAIITIIATTLAVIAGVMLGLWAVQIPSILSMLNWYSAQAGASLASTVVFMLGGGIVARAVGQSSFAGLLIGNIVASFISLPVPIVVDAILLGVVATTFVTMVAVKQSLRAYYKIRYGHSNADGYDFNISLDVTEKDRIQAQRLTERTHRRERDIKDLNKYKILITPENVRDLRVACLKATAAVKKCSHIGNDLTGSRWQLSNSFKDIFHLLTKAEDQNDKENLKALLETSQNVLKLENPVDTVGFTDWKKDCYAKADRSLSKNSKSAIRMEAHQQGMEAALAKFNLHKEFSNCQAELRQAVEPFVAAHRR